MVCTFVCKEDQNKEVGKKVPVLLMACGIAMGAKRGVQIFRGDGKVPESGTNGKRMGEKKNVKLVRGKIRGHFQVTLSQLRLTWES